MGPPPKNKKKIINNNNKNSPVAAKKVAVAVCLGDVAFQGCSFSTYKVSLKSHVCICVSGMCTYIPVAPYNHLMCA
jgi:hypothetical protein